MAKHKIELVCDGNLTFCTVCKGGEGSLTTECCGRPMTEKEEYEVYNLGIRDFIDGIWKMVKNCDNCYHQGKYNVDRWCYYGKSCPKENVCGMWTVK